MSSFEFCVLRCRCARDFAVAVTCSINAERSPRLRAALLVGDFQQVSCPYCRRANIIERDLLYIDFSRYCLVLMLARDRPRDIAAARAVLRACARAIPPWLVPTGACGLHLAIGLPALRELLRAQEAAMLVPGPGPPAPPAPVLFADGAPRLDVRAVLHEVGHAVHARERDHVDAWLTRRFGWRSFTPAEVDAWVDEIGGWGAMNREERRSAREHLRALLGPGGRWGPADVPPLPRAHSWWREGCPPRLAVQGAGVDHWYLRFADWHTRRDQAFFLNYQDAEFAAVAVKTVEVLHCLADARAAISSAEFFAELFAFVATRGHEARAVLPADVIEWLHDLGAAPEPDP